MWAALALAALAADPLDVLDAAESAVREESRLDECPATLPVRESSGDPRILKLGPNEWHIAAALRDFYANDLASVQELASPVPHHGPDGAMVGWRMRLERHGLLHQAGFRNGDVVHSVNGRALDSLPAVLAAYRELRHDDRLVVRLTRRDGRQLRLVYRID